MHPWAARVLNRGLEIRILALDRCVEEAMERTHRTQTVPYVRLFGWIHVLGWVLLWLTSLLSYVQRGTYPIWEPRNFFGLLIVYLSGYGVSVLLLVFLRRQPVERASLGRLVRHVLAGGMAGTALWIVGDQLISGLAYYGRLRWMTPASSMLSLVVMRFPLLFAFSSLDVAFRLWRAWEVQRRQADEALHLAQHAQLEMLRYQLNPHFFFNALNTIRALIDENRADARAMVTELSEFLRYSLARRDRLEVTLAEEVEAIGHYLAVEKKRFEEKLEVRVAVAEAARSWPVLSLLLHPLVENAVKHGMETSPLPLRVSLEAGIVEGHLDIRIQNSGRWKAPLQGGQSAPGGTGTGLANVRRRLENAYPGRHELEVGPQNDGVEALLRLYPPTEEER